MSSAGYVVHVDVDGVSTIVKILYQLLVSAFLLVYIIIGLLECR